MLPPPPLTCSFPFAAGHADAADEAATQMAGHAVAIMVPKTSLLSALKNGEAKGTAIRPASDASVQAGIHAARFSALFPSSFLSSIPESERSDFASIAALVNSKWSDPVVGFQPFAAEGTTPASSRLYVHDPSKREENRVQANADVAAFSVVAPNITRSMKMLESSDTGGHRFYDRFVELSLPTSSPLFSSSDLRSFGAATAHLVLSPDVLASTISTAGASPKDLATGQFLATPLWRTDASDGPLLDTAIAEANANQLPPRGRPMVLNPIQSENLKKSMATLSSLSKLLSDRNQAHVYHPTQHILSYASLVNNPESIRAFYEVLHSNPSVFGDVDVQKVDSIAELEDGTQAGVFASVNLFFPV